MMAKQAPKPSPDQIAMYGHIAAALRAVMKQRAWTVSDMNAACGFARKATLLYPYLRCTSAPSQDSRMRISQATGIPEHDLMPRELATQSTPKAHLVAGPQAVVLRPLNPNPVLTFIVSADGTARIKLDAAMPLSAASPLLRILLDAGLVPSTQGDNTDDPVQ